MAIFGPQNSGTLTAADAARKRELAKQLMGSGFKAKNPLGVLASALEGAASGSYDKEASSAEAAGQKAYADLLQNKDYAGAMSSEWASPQQAALASALQGREWQVGDRQQEWAREDARYAQQQALQREQMSQPQWDLQNINGDIVAIDKRNPAGGAQTVYDGPDPMKDAPNGYRWAQGGNLEFIPGGPNDPSTPGKTTEATRRNQQLAKVIQPEIETLEKNWSALSDVGNQAAGATPMTLGMSSPAYQQAKNSLKTIIASYLYSVSGATANPGEVENQASILTPQFGESPESVAAKLQRVKTMAAAVNEAANGDMGGQTPSGASGAGGADDILKKYGL